MLLCQGRKKNVKCSKPEQLEQFHAYREKGEVVRHGSRFIGYSFGGVVV